jgi:hypothetical protein
VFRRTTLERFVFEHDLGAQGFEAIEEAIADSPELIRVADGKFTTQTALNLELNTIRLMQQGQGQVGAIVPSGTQLEWPGEPFTEPGAAKRGGDGSDHAGYGDGVARSSRSRENLCPKCFERVGSGAGYTYPRFGPQR